MKKLIITSVDGTVLVHNLVDVKGEDFSYTASIPMFLPVVNISLLDLDKDEDKKIKATVEHIHDTLITRV